MNLSRTKDQKIEFKELDEDELLRFINDKADPKNAKAAWVCLYTKHYKNWVKALKRKFESYGYEHPLTEAEIIVWDFVEQMYNEGLPHYDSEKGSLMNYCLTILFKKSNKLTIPFFLVEDEDGVYGDHQLRKESLHQFLFPNTEKYDPDLINLIIDTVNEKFKPDKAEIMFTLAQYRSFKNQKTPTKVIQALAEKYHIDHGTVTSTWSRGIKRLKKLLGPIIQEYRNSPKYNNNAPNRRSESTLGSNSS